MKVTIDAELCTGCGLCVDACPEIFIMDNSVAKVITGKDPADFAVKCREAADNCPVEAISVEE